MTDKIAGRGGALDALAAAFHELALKAAAILKPIPVAPVVDWNISFAPSTGQISMGDGLVPEPAFHLENNLAPIKGSPEYTAVCDIVRNSPSLARSLATDASTGDALRDDVLSQHVNALLNRALVPSFNYDESLVSAILHRLSDELEKPTKTHWVRAYFRLMGVTVSGPTSFANGTIRMLGQDDIRRLVRDSRFYMNDGPVPIDAIKFNSVLEFCFESPDHPLKAELPISLVDYQTALRLVVGPVAFAFATIEYDSVIQTRVPHTLLPYRKNAWQGDAMALLKAVKIDPCHAAQATEFLNLLQSSPNREILATSIRRFNDALERLRLDDAFLDCIIGLESVLTQESHTEVLRRLRQRLSVLIGRSKDDRIAIDAMMLKLYDARSKIAHGDKPKLPIRDAFITGEEYLIRLIRVLLWSPDRFGEAAIDAAILRGDAGFVEASS